MTDEGYGQTGLWDEATLGPVREPVPRPKSSRARTPRSWTAAGDAVAPTGMAPRAPDEAVIAPLPPISTKDKGRQFQRREEAPRAAQESAVRAGDGEGPLDLVPMTIMAARNVRPGDTVWYEGRPQIVKDVSLSGSMGFRPCGPCAPYYGLADVETTVTRVGVRKTGGRLIEHGVTPHPYYTELDGERLGWVSYLLCQSEKQEDADEAAKAAQKPVWWSRRRVARRESLTTF